jgi:hypothetical protein
VTGDCHYTAKSAALFRPTHFSLNHCGSTKGAWYNVLVGYSQTGSAACVQIRVIVDEAIGRMVRNNNLLQRLTKIEYCSRSRRGVVISQSFKFRINSQPTVFATITICSVISSLQFVGRLIVPYSRQAPTRDKE